MTALRNDGFTLIELLVTIAVMAIMATIAVPGFQGMMARNQLAGDHNVLLSGLNQARSEAIKRRENVIFEVTSDMPWRYRVKLEGQTIEEDMIALRSGRGQVSVTNTKIKFNQLGRREDCDPTCTLTVSRNGAGSLELQVSTTGRIGKAP